MCTIKIISKVLNRHAGTIHMSNHVNANSRKRKKKTKRNQYVNANNNNNNNNNNNCDSESSSIFEFNSNNFDDLNDASGTNLYRESPARGYWEIIL